MKAKSVDMLRRCLGTAKRLTSSPHATPQGRHEVKRCLKFAVLSIVTRAKLLSSVIDRSTPIVKVNRVNTPSITQEGTIRMTSLIFPANESVNFYSHP